MLVRVQPCAPPLRICGNCKIEKELHDFNIRRKNNKIYYQSYCKDCASRLKTKWSRENKSHLRSYKINRKYNLSKDQYDDLYWSQNGNCAICKIPLIIGKLTHVDHCHETGRIRGLLCTNCNTGLGIFEKFKKMPEVYEYLNK